MCGTLSRQNGVLWPHLDSCLQAGTSDDLNFSMRIAGQTLGIIILETCEVIIKGLKNEKQVSTSVLF
jgi:hypothetical protein